MAVFSGKPSSIIPVIFVASLVLVPVFGRVSLVLSRVFSVPFGWQTYWYSIPATLRPFLQNTYYLVHICVIFFGSVFVMGVKPCQDSLRHRLSFYSSFPFWIIIGSSGLPPSLSENPPWHTRTIRLLKNSSKYSWAHPSRAEVSFPFFLT